MRGDFSRETFDPLRHFTRVLVQQGRLQMDADANEQSEIHWHFLRTLASDLIGGHGGPTGSFEIAKVGTTPTLDFSIAQGRYYAEGMPAENLVPELTFTKQTGFSEDGALEDGRRHLVYLDVWERQVTALDDPSIRDVALGQVDTTTRAQIVWQVRSLMRQPDGSFLPEQPSEAHWRKWLDGVGGMNAWFPAWPVNGRGALKALGRSDDTGSTEPCIIAPEARFRGLENQLYRVEIHRGGVAGSAKGATFKWSRNNGSDAVAIASLSAGVAKLASPGRGDRAQFEPNDWVEIIEDREVAKGAPGVLAKVISVDPDDMTVTLQAVQGATLPSFTDQESVTWHVQLRRWDYRVGTAKVAGNKPRQADDGALLVEEDKWLALEDGVQVMFTRSTVVAYQYQAADYWLIPARTATGDVEWPGPVGKPDALPPRGVRHYYAPLAIATTAGGGVTEVINLRKKFRPLAEA
jgi:hypothetical protein